MTGMPTEYEERKDLPIFDGLLMYFPLACLAVAEVSRVGNDQHNPGEKLHWARGKSMDQANTALRHRMDHGMGTVKDTDGTWHLAKTAWRDLAELQLAMEAAQARGEKLFTGKAPPNVKKAVEPPFVKGDRVRVVGDVLNLGVGTVLKVGGYTTAVDFATEPNCHVLNERLVKVPLVDVVMGDHS